jgi:S-adenosyl-L-methionine hydrolase (adenosine-forming)
MKHSTVTLTSDWGEADPGIASFKGNLAKKGVNCSFTDISHDILRDDLQHAAYLIESSYRFFPKGTIHCIFCGIPSGAVLPIITAFHDGHFFIIPDNGLISLIFEPLPIEIRTLTNTRLGTEASDIFYFYLEAVYHLLGIEQKNNQHFLNADVWKPFPAPKKFLNNNVDFFDNIISCKVLLTDNFDNVILNITRETFLKVIENKVFVIKVDGKRNITRISDWYGDVPVGDALCRFNSSDYLEIAVNHGSAAELLNFKHKTPQQLSYLRVHIYLM